MNKEQEAEYDELVYGVIKTSRDRRFPISYYSLCYDAQNALKQFVNKCIEDARSPGQFTKAAKK